MKKGLILIMLFCIGNLAYGDINKASLEETLKVNKIEGKILSHNNLGSGLSIVVVDIGNQHIPLLATNDGKMLFQPDVSLFQDKNTERYIQEFYSNFYHKEKASIDEKLKKVFVEKKAQVFHFKAKEKTKKTFYIVADINCPHCQKEFENLDNRLEEANVELLIVGFLGEDSLLKAAYALQNKTNNQSKDIAMLSKLYAPQSRGVAIDTKVARELTQAIADIGVRSVPYIVEK